MFLFIPLTFKRNLLSLWHLNEVSPVKVSTRHSAAGRDLADEASPEDVSADKCPSTDF